MRKKWLIDFLNPKSIYDWESKEFMEAGNRLLEEGKDIELPQSAPAVNTYMLSSPIKDDNSDDD